MSTPNYEKLKKDELFAPSAPPYDDQLNLSTGPTPAGAYGASPSFLPYYSPPAAGPSQGPIIVQQSQTVFVTYAHAQPVKVPDFLDFSIFTMLCCCLPLGIAALVYSVQARDANLAGNITTAKQNSRIAWILNNAALGLGVVFLITIIVYSVVYWL
ncbi:hypothetical protein lerEdw1_009840 [Lerista edwardsae]|nr:hypothetical protein lerEdw1_009840 [Lerista edwardsae]